jgi:ankyrin repeat protein
LTKLLLAAGATVDRVVDWVPLPKRSGKTALCVAAWADAVDVAELLLEAGAAVDPVNIDGRRLGGAR